MRFNHITLIVSDFERSRAFYATLGLVQIVDAPPRYARFQFPDVDASVAALKSKGLSFAQDPTDMSYLWREARLRDPDGHDLRLYNAGDNRLNPPWKIKGS